MVQDGIILSNVLLTEDTYRMEIACDSSHAKPGQFVQVEVPGYFLRRPISICEITSHGLVLVYKVVGQGTQKMAEMKEGNINLFGPLGTGFPVEAKEHVVLMGGGVGVPPLYETAKQYLHQGTKVDVVLGFNTKNQAIYLEEFEALGVRVTVASMDGSIGVKGTVIDAMQEKEIPGDFILACGPLPMLKAIQNTYTKGYISLEARMACGMGACMGCVVKDKEGHSLRVCKDGPVFEIGKVAL